MDHLRVAPVEAADPSAHGFAYRDDVVAMSNRSTFQSALHTDPRAGGQTARQREPGEHRLSLIEERAGGREAIIHVRMVALRGVVSPVPDEEMEVVIVQTSPRELPAGVELFERRPSCERTEGDDVDIGHVEPVEDRGMDVRGEGGGAEGVLEGQGYSLHAADRLVGIL